MKTFYQDGKFYLEDGEKTIELTNIYTDKFGVQSIKLPENSCNRQWVKVEYLKKKGEIDYGDEIKEKRILNLSGDRKSSKKWYEYLDENDMKIALELIEKAENIRKSQINDPVEKMKKKAEEYQRKIEEYERKIQEYEAMRGNKND